MIKQHAILPKLLSRDGAIQRIAAILASLPMEKAWRVEWCEHKLSRSDAQNRYWHGVIVKTLANEVGYEPDEVHEFMCGSWFGWKDKRVPKTPRNPEGISSVPIRTTTRDADGKRSVLSKTEFMDLVDFAQRFAAARGIYIPDPDPNYYAHEEAA